MILLYETSFSAIALMLVCKFLLLKPGGLRIKAVYFYYYLFSSFLYNLLLKDYISLPLFPLL